MAMVADGRSGLNPNAPVFVPNAAYSEVEDFSPEWWDLVKTSPWFREYWLSQHEKDDFTGIVDDYYILDLDDFGADDDQSVESKEHFDPKSKFKTKNLIDVVLEFKSAQFKDLNWYELRKGKGPKAKFREKPAKYASPRCTARRIHQPR